MDDPGPAAGEPVAHCSGRGRQDTSDIPKVEYQTMFLAFNNGLRSKRFYISNDKNLDFTLVVVRITTVILECNLNVKLNFLKADTHISNSDPLIVKMVVGLRVSYVEAFDCAFCRSDFNVLIWAFDKSG
jgi:hypothetical protein